MQVHGVIAIGQELRDGAKECVQQLQQAGINVFLVTGDAPLAAASIASQLGIPTNHVAAGCSPNDKVTAVQAVQVCECVSCNVLVLIDFDWLLGWFDTMHRAQGR